MSDWMDRATPVKDDWKSRATPADASGNGTGAPGVAAMGNDNGPTTAAKPPDWVDNVMSTDAKMGKWIHENAPPWEAVNHGIENAGNAIGKATDYVGGYGRTAAAQLAALIKPGPTQVGLSDWANTAMGHAPHTGDYAERLGVPMGGSIPIPYTNDKKITAKDAADFGGDILLNPLTHGLAKGVGKGLYENAIKPIIVDGERMGKGAVGDVLYKHGVKTIGEMAEKTQPIVNANELANAATDQQAAAHPQADIARPNMSRAMEPAQRQVDAWRKNVLPGSPEEAHLDEMQADIDRHKALDPAEVFHQAPELPGIKTAREARPGEVQLIGPNGKYPGDPLTRYQGGAIADTKGPLPEPAPTPVPQKVQQRLDVKNAYGYTPPDYNPNESVPTPAPTPAVRPTPAPTEPYIESWHDPKGGWKAPQGASDELPSLPVQGSFERTANATPVRTSALKTMAYDDATASAYDPSKRSTRDQMFKKLQGAGLKNETERSIGGTLGTDALTDYQERNAETGSLLSTGKAQKPVIAQNARDLAIVKSVIPSKSEGLLSGALAGKDGVGEGLRAWTAMRFLRALHTSQMPVGYGLRSIPQPLVNSAVVRGAANPWLQPQEQGE